MIDTLELLDDITQKVQSNFAFCQYICLSLMLQNSFLNQI
jgi:hypothetical protein